MLLPSYPTRPLSRCAASNPTTLKLTRLLGTCTKSSSLLRCIQSPLSYPYLPFPLSLRTASLMPHRAVFLSIIHNPIRSMPGFQHTPTLHSCPFDPGPGYTSSDYKSHDAQLPRGLLGNKESSLSSRGGGAVHLLSDARSWKSGPCRDSSDATTGRVGGGAGRAAPHRDTHPATLKRTADRGPTPLQPAASEPARTRGRHLAELATRGWSRAPSQECPGPRS